jgi:hypothetical protein
MEFWIRPLDSRSWISSLQYCSKSTFICIGLAFVGISFSEKYLHKEDQQCVVFFSRKHWVSLNKFLVQSYFGNHQFSIVKLNFVIAFQFDRMKHGFVSHLNKIVCHELMHEYGMYG